MTLYDTLADEIVRDLEEGNQDRIEYHRRMCLTRSKEGLSYLARGVLGMDYWKDEQTGEITRGPIEWGGATYDTRGLVDWGPHGEMLAFLTDPIPGDSAILLMTSRGGLKTSAVQADIIQCILLNPNLRGMVFMETEKKAKETVSAVRGHFEKNEILRAMFGDWVGDKWTDAGFVVKPRTQLNLRDMTLVPVGTDTKITGGHIDKLWIDDPVSWQQARSVEQMLKSIQCYGMLQPILDPGSQTVVTMTPYDEQDLSHHLRTNLGDAVKSLVIDCGMEAVSDGRGGFTLQGEPRFPHHSARFLQSRLDRMGPQDFNAQYAMKILNPEDQIFYRENFIAADWNPRFAGCNAYVMTDTAVTDDDAACRSVIAIVILDWDDTAYLVDLRAGRWDPPTFVDTMMEVVAAWQPRLRLCGLAIEKTSANSVYENQIKDRMRDAGLSLQWIKIPRGGSSKSKNQRIRGLSSRFQAGKFKVLPTVPREFIDRGKPRVLWDPRGFRDTNTGKLLPSGELVESFVRFRYSGGDQLNVDIPDCLADLDTMKPQGGRYLRVSQKPMHDDRKALSPVVERAKLFQMNRQKPQGFWTRMIR